MQEFEHEQQLVDLSGAVRCPTSAADVYPLRETHLLPLLQTRLESISTVWRNLADECENELRLGESEGHGFSSFAKGYVYLLTASTEGL
jgi:hypothetical protein